MRPGTHGFSKRIALSGVERARGFFEIRPVPAQALTSAHRLGPRKAAHDYPARIASSTSLRKGGGQAPPRCFSSQCQWRGSRVTSLAVNAQAQQARGLRRELGIRPFDDLGERAAQVEVNLPPAAFVEDQDARFPPCLRRRRP